MKSIAIVGAGYVGKAMIRFFSDRFFVKVYDPFSKGDSEEFNHLNVQLTEDKEVINLCDFAVICVPTPMQEDKSVDLSIVEDTMSWLNVPLILIKSTIPPGTTDMLRQSMARGFVSRPNILAKAIMWCNGGRIRIIQTHLI